MIGEARGFSPVGGDRLVKDVSHMDGDCPDCDDQLVSDLGVHGNLKARHLPLAANEFLACFFCLPHVILALGFGRILHRSRDSPKSKTSVTLTGLLDNVGLEIPGAQPRHRVELLGVEGFKEFSLGVDLVGELGQELAQAVGRVGVAASGHR